MLDKGATLSLLTVMLWAVVIIGFRFASAELNAHPVVFACLSLFTAAGVLILIAGPGLGGLATVARPHSWIYGIFQVCLAVAEIATTIYVSATEASLLLRTSIIISLITAWLFFNRSPKRWDGLGAVLIVLGLGLLISQLPAENIPVVILFIVAAGIFQTGRTMIAELHPDSISALTIKGRCRVTGYVLLVTSFCSLIVFFAIARMKLALPPSQLETLPLLAAFPNTRDFLHQPTMFSAMVVGAVAWAPAMYFYFYAARVAKTENFMIFTAFMPLFTLLFESLVSLGGWLTLRSLTLTDVLAGGAVIAGALAMVWGRAGGGGRR